MVFAIVQKNVLTLRSCMLKYTRLKSWFSEKRKYTERRVVKHLELLNSNEECTLLQYFSGFENVQKLKKKKALLISLGLKMTILLCRNMSLIFRDNYSSIWS